MRNVKGTLFKDFAGSGTMLKPDLYQIFTINSVVIMLLLILTVHHEVGLQLMIIFSID